MGFRLQDLPAYIMMGAVIGFFIFVQSRKPDNEKEDKKTTKK